MTMQTDLRQRLLRGCFGAYCLFLLFLLFFCRTVHEHCNVQTHFLNTANLVPFRTLSRHGKGFLTGLRYLFGEHHTVTWQLRYYGQNLLGNLVMFFPFGMLVPCLLPKCNKLWKTVLLTVCTVTLLEIIQTLLRVGCMDIDDLILNTAGAVGGYLIYRIPPIHRFLRGEEA